MIRLGKEQFLGAIAAACLSAGALLACGGARDAVVTPTPPEQTLYSRLGGIEVLRQLVDAWMLEVTTDPRIRDFFASADMGRVKLRLVERVCVLVEGPCLYRGVDLRELHAPLKIEGRHMRAFLELLEPAMKRANISEGLARELMEVMTVLGAQVSAPPSS